jgi:hypothetical protein
MAGEFRELSEALKQLGELGPVISAAIRAGRVTATVGPGPGQHAAGLSSSSKDAPGVVQHAQRVLGDSLIANAREITAALLGKGGGLFEKGAARLPESLPTAEDVEQASSPRRRRKRRKPAEASSPRGTYGVQAALGQDPAEWRQDAAGGWYRTAGVGKPEPSPGLEGYELAAIHRQPPPLPAARPAGSPFDQNQNQDPGARAASGQPPLPKEPQSKLVAALLALTATMRGLTLKLRGPDQIRQQTVAEQTRGMSWQQRFERLAASGKLLTAEQTGRRALMEGPASPRARVAESEQQEQQERDRAFEKQPEPTFAQSLFRPGGVRQWATRKAGRWFRERFLGGERPAPGGGAAAGQSEGFLGEAGGAARAGMAGAPRAAAAMAPEAAAGTLAAGGASAAGMGAAGTAAAGAGLAEAGAAAGGTAAAAGLAEAGAGVTAALTGAAAAAGTLAASVAAPVVAIAAIGLAAVGAAAAIKGLAESTIESYRGLQKYSASINNLMVALDLQQRHLDIQFAQKTSGSAEVLGQELAKLREEWEPIREVGQTVVNLLETGLIELARGIIVPLKLIAEVIQAIEEWLDLASQKDADKRQAGIQAIQAFGKAVQTLQDRGAFNMQPLADAGLRHRRRGR